MQLVRLNVPVTVGALAIIFAFVAIGVVVPHEAETIFGNLQSGILDRFGWLYILSVAVFVSVMLIMCLGRYGTLKLGPDEAEPDFAYGSWVAMLFAAGMGIGLMYFAVGEPLTHFAAPPEAQPRSIGAEREAMVVTFFHWGIHAWAIYGVVGLSLAYFGYRYNLPLTIRSGLYPLLKERIHGPLGHAVDIFAICGTLFGLATSLGFGVLQISAGLDYLGVLTSSLTTQVVLIAVITGAATLSVVTGLDKGVRRLSELNLALAVLLMVFVLAVGPTAELLRLFVQNIGLYLDRLILKTFNIYAYEPKPWIDSWTLFYWAWWISWSPFVGMFIARISRGRTVREFIIAVLFVPAGFTFLWFTIFGNTALFIDTTVANGALAQAVTDDVSVGLFRFFEYLPLSTVTSSLAIMLVAVFFVTSSDSGSMVVDTIAAGGASETPVPQRVFWCALEGTVAAVLLAAGGLTALQSATIATALPFCFIMFLLCFGLFRGMNADLAHTRSPGVAATAHAAIEITWQQRLWTILRQPREEEVGRFIAEVAEPALNTVAEGFRAQGREAEVARDSSGFVSMTVPAEGFRNFVYGVQHVAHRLPVFTASEASQKTMRHEARTFFSDGSHGYDVMGLSREQVIADVLAQYEHYQALVQSPSSALYAAAPEHEVAA
ncbi:BCCT family transporter [Marinivivus vitaminiproducens]|uniref:BCCT family transporter n=1 Tax=Marinivivus vitaminiproducens TaxID=3035935 RepID=UPI0027983FCF|nr:BCCT family transporter [Geminicoccaceae bacterium SCSIO 64248]